MKIAVLLATFNRKEKTLACLQNLKDQEMPPGFTLEVFLTDDASTDGTVEGVKSQFPEVHVYHGTGNFFWSGGMRNSWTMALSSRPEYYLLLNDDTFLYQNALKILLQSSTDFYNDHSRKAIIVGSTIDPDSGEITYGGRKLYSKYRPQCYMVQPGSSYIECDLGNSNIMLVPADIVDKTGILSSDYTHGIADFDYSLRAKRDGFAVVIAPGILGICIDDHGKKWKSSNVKFSERIEYLYSVKGLAYKEYLSYIKKFFPYNLPDAFIKLWLKTLFPIIYDKLKK